MDTFFNTEDLFTIFDGLDHEFTPILDQTTTKSSPSSSCFHDLYESEMEMEGCKKRKRGKVEDGEEKVAHIAVERNRRKQMNHNLSVLRSLMPCFYVKRGDQASIIGGVVDYINELQQILTSLQSKKQRKLYTEVLSPNPSPRVVSSTRPSLSPKKPPLSPRLNLPISPRTPQPCSPYKPRLRHVSPTTSLDPSLSSSPSNSDMVSNGNNELVASSKSAIADVEVKLSGPNVLVKTVSHRIPGQALKIISALEGLSLEILEVNVMTVEDTMLVNSFTIKIGIECQLSAQELAQEIQQTFCYS